MDRLVPILLLFFGCCNCCFMFLLLLDGSRFFVGFYAWWRGAACSLVDSSGCWLWVVVPGPVLVACGEAERCLWRGRDILVASHMYMSASLPDFLVC
ncbi:hypothetical protein MtrunA17_Chr4g0042921 [Medicago truncatula]|uniref:Transmembrane protein, putative n=1 Tax=Medicago truncatula TaxID=3880 RepID=A0A072UP66_MEDTR|nr:transmembrane protein, putative [Medicago truncatula]RHN62023.1 hypothetical protein MtrunA17_Chr4g0042921 [Medicago truncatula]